MISKNESLFTLMCAFKGRNDNKNENKKYNNNK